MLTTVHAARGFAMLMSWMCPSCRLPMVGTNTLLGTRRRRSRRSAAEWITSMRRAQPRLERMFRTGEGLGLHFLDVELHSALDRAAGAHVVLDEFRLLPGVHVEHVVQHQHLARAVHAGADADSGDRQRGSDVARERRGIGFQNNHAGSCLLELLRPPQQGLPVAPPLPWTR